jgi:acetyl esterase/lipase
MAGRCQAHRWRHMITKRTIQGLARERGHAQADCQDRVPLLVMRGEADPLVPDRVPGALEQIVREAGISARVVSIPGLVTTAWRTPRRWCRRSLASFGARLRPSEHGQKGGDRSSSGEARLTARRSKCGVRTASHRAQLCYSRRRIFHGNAPVASINPVRFFR